jgi:holo-[acyl-carrier protein] synthase
VAVIGVGLDAVDVERFRKVIARRPRVLDRLFSPAEQTRLSARADPIPGYAARFAAKEAAMKALHVGLATVGFADFEIIDLDSGAPLLLASGRAAELAASLGVSKFEVSLTHSDAIAGAIVLAY